MATPVPGGFGLYLHWPFCQSKCPYCDFNSHVSATINHDHWRVAYLSEIDRAGRETAGRLLETVYFGGGTPSLMDPDVVGDIIGRVRATWPMVNDPEITLEANPGSVEAGRFRAYAAAGVNRVSMGIQALNDGDLRRLGRLHTAREARAAFDVAAGVFGRTSFDLIYARQDQTLATWANELSAALDWAGDHLSLYQLTIEPGTAFGDRHAKGGLNGLPCEDLAADMYLKTNDICEDAGFHAYEVSNYARPGAEARHNLIYWRGGDYVGIGPGAHGRLTRDGRRHATETPLLPQVWLDSVQALGSGERRKVALSSQEWGQEYLMMGLRTTEGVSISRHREVNGGALDAGAVSELTGLGLLDLKGDRLCATPDGRLVLNGVLRRLMRADETTSHR